ncbi:uncharacterized protein ARB_04292 [Trichophyton benhamiae CBS 112371]|uniref:Uncharacterized protein n=1 Tax=Arthroderma benhamiae (strain ATCC MYA-4681 / CBS 112371) TaxID=663331 RepID=D4AJ44_ARTBC|nr:uncharacterized protein ARB_04292 [Trichophyton benhamiae CBS 112371]EFE36767.1 hypothetical protein ARB_04292 [Trichophyton benhamiae CBS 112371]
MKQADTDGQQVDSRQTDSRHRERTERVQQTEKDELQQRTAEDDADDGTDERRPKTADEDDAVTAEKRDGRWTDIEDDEEAEGRSLPGLSLPLSLSLSLCLSQEELLNPGRQQTDGGDKTKMQDEEEEEEEEEEEKKGERELVKKKKGEKVTVSPTPIHRQLARKSKPACQTDARQSCHQASEGGGDDAAPSPINPSSIIHVYGKPYGFYLQLAIVFVLRLSSPLVSGFQGRQLPRALATLSVPLNHASPSLSRPSALSLFQFTRRRAKEKGEEAVTREA